MIVYRVSRTKYANDITGEGAKLFGGRWNHKGVACIYTSESRALAVLEYTVNVSIDEIPRALSIVTLEIPETKILLLKSEDLPGNWKDSPAPASTKDICSNILLAGDFAVIKIPSSVIPEEFNYILNPTAGNDFKLLDLKDFIYDLRIKMV